MVRALMCMDLGWLALGHKLISTGCRIWTWGFSFWPCTNNMQLPVLFTFYLNCTCFLTLIWSNTYKVSNICLRVVAQKLTVLFLVFWCDTITGKFKDNSVQTSTCNMSSVTSHTLHTCLGFLILCCNVDWTSYFNPRGLSHV